jgi:hypothetical protein
VIGGLGVLASIALLLASTGSNDIRTWESFARRVGEDGLIELYRSDRLFNHPPLMGYLAWLCGEIADRLRIPFPIVFKLPSVLANVGTAVLLMSLWRSRGNERAGRHAFALYCWSICAILVGAFHGNTDCIVVFACVACLYLLEVRQQSGLAGLALAAAINVKIIPVLLFLPLLATQRTARTAGLFTLGTAAGAIPFALAGLFAGDALLRNVFQYGSNLELWGPQLLIYALGTLPDVGPAAAQELTQAYYGGMGRTAILASAVVLAAYGYWRKVGPATLMAATLCSFLVFAPAFGVQYTVYLVAPILAVSLDWAPRYDVFAGLFILLVYLLFRWGEWLPLTSFHNAAIPLPHAAVGFAAWAVAVCFLVACLRQRSPEPAGEADAGTPA